MFFGLERKLHGDSPFDAPESQYPTPVLEWRVEPAFYWSTPHNDTVSDNKRIHMIGVDPMLTYRPWSYKGIGHAIGASWNHLFVPNADDTERAALKLRPFALETRHVNLSWNVRYYWDGVTTEDVRATPRPDEDRRGEVIWKSFSVGYYF
jgi:hypothetical protein